MSNVINKIRLSGTDYTLSATSSGGITSGEVQTMIDESVSGITERMAEDEEVTAAALNNLNDRISGISGNNAVEVTQAEYDALVSGGTVDPTAFYIITDAQAGDLTQYWTSAQTNSAITAAVSGKQDTLSAGTGIDITNNVISATGGGGGEGKAVEAGRGIDVASGTSAYTVSFNLPISAGTGTNSVIEGNTSNKASGDYSHAEGNVTTASGQYSHAEGFSTTAKGNYSHAEGNSTNANGDFSHAEGIGTTANNLVEHASGQYNVSNKASSTFGNSGNTLFSVGNGANNLTKHNAFEIRQNGDIYLTLNGQDIKLQDQLGGSSITVDSALDSGSTNPVENRVIYNKFDEVEQVTARALNELNDKIGNINTILESI